MKKRSLNLGFTIFELLVVIAIIGILTTIMVLGIDNARKTARDSERISELAELRLAIENFYNDNGHYPGWPDWEIRGFTGAYEEKNWYVSSHMVRPCQNANCGNFWTGVGPGPSYPDHEFSLMNYLGGYISEIPIDPLNEGYDPTGSSNNYTYAYKVDGEFGQSYDLIARLESKHSLRCEIKQYRANTTGRLFYNLSGGHTFESGDSVCDPNDWWSTGNRNYIQLYWANPYTT